MEPNDNISLLEEYLTRRNINIDNLNIHSSKFELYRSNNNKLQEVCNFAVFPKKKYEERSDNWIVNCTYVCDLLVQDWNYGSWIMEKEITIIQNEHLRTFETLKQFLILQEPTIVIKNFSKKVEKDVFLDLFRLNLTAGFEKVFGLETWYKVERIGFNEDWSSFTFNNWKLNLTDWTFEKWEYKLVNDSSISLSYEDEVEDLTLEQCLKDLIPMEGYVSSEATIASITIWYLVCGIFRKQYKEIHNEFPFLWFEGYSWTGKTSLLNFLSRVVWYNWNSINGVCDSDYAFEVGMNSLWSWFYFVDEIQKISSKLQKYIQAAYNSWENHKWGANGNWQEIQTYKKDCSLIAAWEILPQQEEALLNRFIICCPQKPFAVKKQVTDCDEFIKFMELSNKDVANVEYLNTDEIRYLAVNYYKPRFMYLLKHKNLINFNKYHSEAVMLVEKFAGSSIDTRHKNNLVCPLTWYLILRQDNIDEEEVKNIVEDYFSKLQTYRKHSIMSWMIVDYVLDNIDEFSSWMGRVKWTSQTWPMIWVKSSEKEQGLILQIDNIIRYCKNKIENKLSNKHSKQQFVQLLWIKDIQSWVIKFAKWTRNIAGAFIPFSIVEWNEFLRKIWDATLSYQHWHVEELKHVLKWEDVDLSVYKQSIQKVMPSEILRKLCEELECTNEKASFFDKTFEETDEDSKPF